MNLAEPSLYYPDIQIPESALVHALLFKDKIKRIIPPLHQLGNSTRSRTDLENRVLRQYLGYDFIEGATYSDAKKNVATHFCRFLDKACKSRSPKKFEALLGLDYKKNLPLSDRASRESTQHFVYAHKFDREVFDKIESLGWMKGNRNQLKCEMRSELCKLYMTVLAAGISKETGEPISTNDSESELILRKPEFQKHFASLVPPQMQVDSGNTDFCLTFLFGDSNEKVPPFHKVFRIEEAARIRAGLESERVSFCGVVDDLVKKAVVTGSENLEELIALESKDLLQASQEYVERVRIESVNAVTRSRRHKIQRFKSGVSLTLPLIGGVADSMVTGMPLGTYASVGAMATLGLFLIPNIGAREAELPKASERQQAYIFMDRMWQLSGLPPSL